MTLIRPGKREITGSDYIDHTFYLKKRTDLCKSKKGMKEGSKFKFFFLFF